MVSDATLGPLPALGCSAAPDPAASASPSTGAAPTIADLQEAAVAAGHEATAGDAGGTARLKEYWAHGAGRQKWINSPHPWTTLRDLLLKYVSKRVADGLASNIFHLATGIWPGDRKGDNPIGPG